jgi:hypothetical protein
MLGSTIFVMEKMAASNAAPWVDHISAPDQLTLDPSTYEPPAPPSLTPRKAAPLRRVWSFGKSVMVSSLRKLHALPRSDGKDSRRAG